MGIAPDSFLGWCKFALARDFENVATQQLHVYPKTTVERIGHVLRWGVGTPLDFLFREITNPITLVALTALAALVVTIAFYPATVLGAVTSVVPMVAYIQPWMLKMALYILVQTTILGLGLRAYGRFQNPQLCQQWREGEIRALFVGAHQP